MQVPESEVKEEHTAPCSEAAVHTAAWLRRKYYVPLARCFSELRANTAASRTHTQPSYAETCVINTPVHTLKRRHKGTL